MKIFRKIVHFPINVLRRIYIFFLVRFFYFLRINNTRISFINFNGRGFGENPKYIANEMIRQHLECDFFWHVLRADPAMPKEIKMVTWGSVESMKVFATSKVIITNVKNRIPFIKKNKQILIQLWHGCIPMKKVEKEAKDVLSLSYIKQSVHNSKISDLFVSSGKLQTERFRNNFWYDGEILEAGCPKFDGLFNSDEESIKNIKNRIGANNQKIAIYAPTFRDDYSSYKRPDFNRVINALEKRFGGKWLFLIRLHPNEKKDETIVFNNRVIDASNYPDIEEILCVCDFMISDFSSACLEFALLKKPVCLFVPDYESYLKKRGMNQLFFDLTFPICRNQQELERSIFAVNFETTAQSSFDRISKFVDTKADGKASFRVVEWIKNKISI